MSKIDKWEKSARQEARSDGSHETREAREQTVSQFADWLRENNRQIDEARNRDIRDYIESRREAGVSLGRMQNEASHLRKVDGQRLSYTNRELGISGRNRDGTHTAISEQQYRERAENLRDPGVRAAAELQKTLGLRAKEAVMSGKSLSSWQKALSRGDTVRVVHGTKGGRMRIAEVPDRERALSAVNAAIQVAQGQQGKMVDSPHLKAAVSRYSGAMRRAGFKGELAPHSLRYAYTNALLAKYEREGMDRQEALAATAESLGHGDGRGDYVAQVYSR